MNIIKSIILVGFLLNACLSFSQNKETIRTSLLKIDSKSTTNNTVTATTYTKNGIDYVYSGGDGGYIDVFKINSTGKLTTVGTYELFNKKGPARGIVADNIAGNDYLFVGNKNGNAIEVFHIENAGTLKRVLLLKDTDETHLGTVITLKVIHMKKTSYLFAGGLERKSPGLSCFKIHTDGKLTHVQSMKDNDTIHTDGIIGMYSHKIKNKTFLFTGGFQDNGISSFEVFENGHFKNISNITDNTTNRYLTGTYPVDGVTLGNNNYVVVGHRHHKFYTKGITSGWIKKTDFVYHGDGVSVFKITSKGELIPHHVLIDDKYTKISGQTRIEILKLNADKAIVAIATRDDSSIQICILSKDGKLTPSGYLETGYPIYYGMASKKIGADFFLFAGSVDPKLKQLHSYKINFEKDNKVLRHIVTLKYKKELTSKKIDEAVMSFIDLKNKIPEIINFEWGG